MAAPMGHCLLRVVRDVTAQEKERSLGHVDHAHQSENECETARDDEEQAGEREAVQQRDEEVRRIVDRRPEVRARRGEEHPDQREGNRAYSYEPWQKLEHAFSAKLSHGRANVTGREASCNRLRPRRIRLRPRRIEALARRLARLRDLVLEPAAFGLDLGLERRYVRAVDLDESARGVAQVHLHPTLRMSAQRLVKGLAVEQAPFPRLPVHGLEVVHVQTEVMEERRLGPVPQEHVQLLIAQPQPDHVFLEPRGRDALHAEELLVEPDRLLEVVRMHADVVDAKSSHERALTLQDSGRNLNGFANEERRCRH